MTLRLRSGQASDKKRLPRPAGRRSDLRVSEKSAFSVPIRNCHMVCFQRFSDLRLMFCVPINFLFASDEGSADFCVGCNVYSRFPWHRRIRTVTTVFLSLRASLKKAKKPPKRWLGGRIARAKICVPLYH